MTLTDIAPSSYTQLITFLSSEPPLSLPANQSEESTVTIELYSGDLDNLVHLFQMSTWLDSVKGVKHLIAIEKTRGTQYYVAKIDNQIVGFIGVWFDPTNTITKLEPPQIIDLAVLPSHQRKGIAKSLVNHAVQVISATGFDRVWLFTDGNSPILMSCYTKLGFRLVSTVPDWFGDDTTKAIFRLDIDV